MSASSGVPGTVALPDGTHLVPVGFGLLAPSGAYAAGLTFVARDVVQRTTGRRWAVAAILGGTVLAVLLSGVVGSVIDSVIFLGLAGIPLASALPGLLLAKLWVQLLAVPVAAWLRG